MASISLKKIIYRWSPPKSHPFFKKIADSDVALRLARGVFWSIAGSVISRGLILCATVLVARMLGKTVYGELGIIQSTVGMFGVFAGFGLGLTATKFVAEFRQSDPVRAGRIIGLSTLFAMGSGGLMAIGLLIFAPWLAQHTINAPQLAGILRIGALVLFINALNGAQTGALSGFEAFKTIAHINLFVGLISFPILVCGAYFGGLTGAVWALVLNLCFNWLLNNLALQKEALRHRVPISFRDCSMQWPVLWRFSLPAALGRALVGPVDWACGAMLVNRPDGFAEMGLFNAANQWRIAILFIPGMLGQVLLPLLSNLNEKSSEHQYRKLLVFNVFLNAAIALVVVLPLMLLSRVIMSSYGPEFENGTSVLRVLAFSAVLAAVNYVVGQAIVSKGKMWIGFTFNSLWAIVLLITSWILLHKGYGALGLAYATFIAYVLHTVWQSIYFMSVIGKNGVYQEPSS